MLVPCPFKFLGNLFTWFLSCFLGFGELALLFFQKIIETTKDLSLTALIRQINLAIGDIGRASRRHLIDGHYHARQGIMASSNTISHSLKIPTQPLDLIADLGDVRCSLLGIEADQSSGESLVHLLAHIIERVGLQEFLITVQDMAKGIALPGLINSLVGHPTTILDRVKG